MHVGEIITEPGHAGRAVFLFFQNEPNSVQTTAAAVRRRIRRMISNHVKSASLKESFFSKRTQFEQPGTRARCRRPVRVYLTHCEYRVGKKLEILVLRGETIFATAVTALFVEAARIPGNPHSQIPDGCAPPIRGDMALTFAHPAADCSTPEMPDHALGSRIQSRPGSWFEDRGRRADRCRVRKREG